MTETEAARSGLKAIFRLSAAWFADVLRIVSGAPDGLVNSRWRSEMEGLADALDAEQAAEAINRLAQAGHQLDLNVNTQLVVENLLNDLVRKAVGRPVS